MWVLSEAAAEVMSAEVREEKTQQLKECLKAVKVQMAALDGLLFALENPLGSDL